MELRIKGTRLFYETVMGLDKYKYIVHEGGSRSSKSWSILQVLLMRALEGQNEDYTIVRDRLTWIKSTLLKDLVKMVDMYKLEISPEINANRQDQIYKINGSEFAFFGLDYAEKLHGRTQDFFWINEAMSVSKQSFDQLKIRTKKGGFIDYNPAGDDSWVYDIQKRKDVLVIKSTQLDNPFLEKTIREEILSYEPTPENIARGTADNYMWKVYGLGEIARPEGIIFTNWDIVNGIPEEAKLLGLGLDFGYSVDPTAVIEVYIMDNELYLNELVYETGLLNQDIANILKVKGIDRSVEIYADSAEPKSIEEIYRYGLNIRATDKGADSIRYGIDLLKARKIHITKSSLNLEKEFRNYKYVEDRNGKVVPNKPIDFNNHGIDASRYLAIMKLGNKGTVRTFTSKPNLFR